MEKQPERREPRQIIPSTERERSEELLAPDDPAVRGASKGMAQGNLAGLPRRSSISHSPDSAQH